MAARGLRLATLTTAILLLGACGDSGDDRAQPTTSSTSDPDADIASGEGQSVAGGTTVPCAPPATIPIAEADGHLPPGVTLPDDAGLLEVTENTVTGQTATDVSPLLQRFRSQLEAAGAKIGATDNEGHEAELEFETKAGVEGELRERRVSCPPGTTRFTISLRD
jgi:hypothetical protein